jgi:hypothetical protein
MPRTKLCDTECPNEMSATLHIHQTGRYKKNIDNKNVLTKYDVQSKINIHEIYRINNEIILQHGKKVNTHGVYPLL